MLDSRSETASESSAKAGSRCVSGVWLCVEEDDKVCAVGVWEEARWERREGVRSGVVGRIGGGAVGIVLFSSSLGIEMGRKVG